MLLGAESVFTVRRGGNGRFPTRRRKSLGASLCWCKEARELGELGKKATVPGGQRLAQLAGGKRTLLEEKAAPPSCTWETWRTQVHGLESPAHGFDCGQWQRSKEDASGGGADGPQGTHWTLAPACVCMI